MASLLYKIGSAAYRLKWPFIAFWLIVVIGIGSLAALFSKPTSDNFVIPGIDSVETMDKLNERFGQANDPLQAPSGTILVESKAGKLTDPEIQGHVAQMIDELKSTNVLVNTDQLFDPASTAMGMKKQMTEAKAAQGIPQDMIDADFAAVSPLSEDETTGLIDVTFDAESSTDVTQEQRDKVNAVLEQYNSDDLTVVANGNAFQGMPEMQLTSELIGMAFAAVVLLITFGSLVAAGMPLISAVVGVAIGLLGITALTAVSSDISSMTPALASMIGLAVGIDYALFILARFRNELVKAAGAADLEPKDFAQALKNLDKPTRTHAMGMAVGTAGSAVVFAGLTVIIALTALSIINIPFLTAMALTAAATVAVAVLVALTFLPAFVGLFGTKIFAGRVGGIKVPDPENENPTMGLKWVRRIRKHPWLHLGAGVIVLALLAIPAANMRLAMPTAGSEPIGSNMRTAYDITAEKFGDGRNAPMIGVIDLEIVDPQARQGAMQEALQAISGTEGVVNAQVVATTEDFDTAQVLITPEGGATDEITSETLVSLRDLNASFTESTGGEIGVTGMTPIFDDVSDRLSDVLLPYIAIVLVLAFLVLMLVFRSIWVPLIAALGFALSVAATFGVTVAVFQQGTLGIIDDPQPLLSFLPIMLIGLVFGLAMDYQVFLVTRMREGWAHGKTAGNATANGYKHGARVVTAAALIMIFVFAAFMAQDMPFIKTMGFALAVAVAFDAFIVRMTIIPATMFLLDERAWWLPKWMDKILPKVDIEGEALAEQHDKAHV
ncbi:MMPL family transporter [Corynebacterium sp. ZY180755]